MLRLGLCCLFVKADIPFRTTTVRYIASLPSKGRDRFAYLGEIIQHNVLSLYQAVLFCADHGIGAFRIRSDLFPIYTHPEWGYALEDLPCHRDVIQGLCRVKEIVKDRSFNHRYRGEGQRGRRSPLAETAAKKGVESRRVLI